MEKFQADLLESVRQMGDMAAARVAQVEISEAAEAAGIVWIKFIGTHAEYDLIDVTTIGSH